MIRQPNAIAMVKDNAAQYAFNAMLSDEASARAGSLFGFFAFGLFLRFVAGGSLLGRWIVMLVD